MATNQQQQQQHDEQLHVLQESFPQASQHKLVFLLRRHDGNVEQVRFLFILNYNL
jgi:hypothetical protein